MRDFQTGPEYLDWLAAKVGTTKWAVAARMSPRLKAKGYEAVITPKRYRALEAEYAALKRA